MGLKKYCGYCPAFLFLALAALILLCPAPAQCQSTGSLYFAVTDDDGAPLPGAVITAGASGRLWTTVSRADGRARLMMLLPGTYQVSATMPGFRTWTGFARVTLGGTTQVNITLQVDTVQEELVAASQVVQPKPSTLIESQEWGMVRVVLSSDGQPLAGAAVQLFNAEANRFQSTDSAGAAEFTQVPPGDYFLTASAGGYEAQTWSDIWVGSSHTATLNAQLSKVDSATGQAALGEQLPPATLEQKPLQATAREGRIEFNVFDPSGSQAANAVCIVIGGEGIYLDFTDSTGLTEFNGLPFDYYILHVHKDGAEDWFADIDLFEPNPPPVVANLTALAQAQAPEPQADEQAGGISFTLLQADGTPEAYGTVYLVNHADQQLIFGVTDAAGELAFSSLNPGTYYLFAQNMNPETVEVVAGQTLELTGVMNN